MSDVDSQLADDRKQTERVDSKHVSAVRQKLRDRARTGLRKYGVTTERMDLTNAQWLTHAQEEAMDLAVYLERIIKNETDRVAKAEIAQASLIEYDAELTALRSKFKGLKEYAQHKDGCAQARSFCLCTCGLDNLIREDNEDTES